jgi:hypothetical protein
MKRKVLLLLSGQLRTYDNEIVVRGWDKFLDKYDVTTFMSCWDNRGRSLYSQKHYSNDMVVEEESINEENVKPIFRTENIQLLKYEDWLSGAELQDWMKRFMRDEFFNSVFAAFFLRKQVYNFAMDNIKEYDFDGVFLTRPDSFFIREPPDYPFLETEYIWQQNARDNFFPNRIYDNFLFSSLENIEKICALYDSPLLSLSIERNFGTRLHYLDPCKVLYSYFNLANIKHKSYDYLYTEPYRRVEDLKEHRDRYLGGDKMWCEE